LIEQGRRWPGDAMDGAPEQRPKQILWRSLLAGALLLLVGLVSTAFLLGNVASDVSIWVLGRSVTGRVVDQGVEQIGDANEGELTFRYLITYEFTTRSGRTITKTTTLAAPEWSSLGVGSPVSVLYFPLFPSHARLADQRFIAVYLCSYLPFALVGWAGMSLGWYLFRQGTGHPHP
jgi:hypothetical protein